MTPNAIYMLLSIALGFGLSAAFKVFNARTVFGKTRKTSSFFLQLAIVVGACVAAGYFTHNWNNWLLPLIGFFVIAKIDEARDKRQKLRAARAEFQAEISNALAARKHDAEIVEIDVSKAPDAVRWTLINSRTKQGLTVETLKNHATGSVKLRFSGRQGRARGN